MHYLCWKKATMKVLAKGLKSQKKDVPAATVLLRSTFIENIITLEKWIELAPPLRKKKFI
jgi:hypothetical protein